MLETGRCCCRCWRHPQTRGNWYARDTASK